MPMHCRDGIYWISIGYLWYFCLLGTTPGSKWPCYTVWEQSNSSSLWGIFYSALFGWERPIPAFPFCSSNTFNHSCAAVTGKELHKIKFWILFLTPAVKPGLCVCSECWIYSLKLSLWILQDPERNGDSLGCSVESSIPGPCWRWETWVPCLPGSSCSVFALWVSLGAAFIHTGILLSPGCVKNSLQGHLGV